MSELKPCPFCGGTKVKFIEYSDAIECLTCTALGPDDKIDTWNTRPLEDAKDAEIARLKEDKASLEKSILDQSHALVDEIASLRVECNNLYAEMGRPQRYILPEPPKEVE